MRILLCFSVLLVMVSSSCKKTYPTTIVNNDTTIIVRTDTVIVNNNDTTIYGGDAQVRLRLGDVGTVDTNYISDIYSSIAKFNIGYYPGVDSVIWMGYAGTNTVDQSSPLPSTIELYNLTDNTPIAGSQVDVPVSDTPRLVMSKNCFGGFPSKEINIGIRIRNGKQGLQYTGVIAAALYLYRN